MNDYPVDVPSGAISSLVRLLRADLLRSEGREFARSCWLVQGFLMRAAIGVPAPLSDADGQPPQPARSMPTITAETQSHFHELHGLLMKSKPITVSGFVDELVDDVRASTARLLDLWLTGKLPLDPGPVAAAIAEIRVFDPAQAKVDSEFGIGAPQDAAETIDDEDEQREAA